MKHVFTKILAFVLVTMIVFTTGVPSYAYTVKEGDTLNQIAKENNVSVDDLLKWNNVQNKNLIYPGQEIKLQKKMTSSNKALSSEEIQILYSMFAAEYYAEKNPDVVNAVGNEEANLFEHFCTYGLYELRQPNKDFNVAAYAAAYNDLSAAFGTEVVLYYRHLYEFGKTEGRTITTMEALAATGVNAKALSEQQYTVKDENGRPRFNVFYEEGVKDFVLPALPAPEPEPEKSIKISDILASLKDSLTEDNPWKNTDGDSAFISGTAIQFTASDKETHYYRVSTNHDTVATANGYEYTGQKYKITFIVKDNVLAGIDFQSSEDKYKDLNGTFEAPAPTPTPE